MTERLTLKLSNAQRLRLEEIAEYEQVPLETLLAQAAERIIQQDQSFRVAIEEGRAAFERGDRFSHEEVVARAEHRAAALRDVAAKS